MQQASDRIGGMSEADPMRPVRVWLYVVAAMVLAMVVVGGATRLTDSGLSITEWKPLMGLVPPLSSADWQDAFDKYRQIPEYKLVNRGMSLDAFKRIFWWEWGHRFLGRLVGFVFALPFAFFLLTRRIGGPLAIRLAGLLALGGLQGAVGWYMVQSGLVDRVDVSQYRLALHLSIAVVILVLSMWTAWQLVPAEPGSAEARPRSAHGVAAKAIFALVMLQVVLGALVAGTKAGLSHNTWPLMDGRFVPRGLGVMSPWYLNLTENVLAVQFNHRMMAYVLLLLVGWHVVSVVRSIGCGKARVAAMVMMTALVLQAGLGIWTLLAHVPISLGIAHQGLAAVIAVLAAWNVFRLQQAESFKVL